jgi:hypothetical protein
LSGDGPADDAPAEVVGVEIDAEVEERLIPLGEYPSVGRV